MNNVFSVGFYSRLLGTENLTDCWAIPFRCCCWWWWWWWWLQGLPCLLANNIYANSCDSDFESDNKIQCHALVPDIIYIYPTRYNLSLIHI